MQMTPTFWNKSIQEGEFNGLLSGHRGDVRIVIEGPWSWKSTGVVVAAAGVVNQGELVAVGWINKLIKPICG